MTIKVGDPFPDFSLPTDGGGTLSLADLRGKKAVIYFYPKDDTPGCTKEAQGFRDSAEAFAEAGTVVVGVSTDSVSSHDRFKTKHRLNFVLVADPQRVLVEAAGVWVEKSMYGKKYMGTDRSTFLIDADGVVRQIWHKVKVPNHVAEVLAAAKSL
jgi:peroxiredoxin